MLRRIRVKDVQSLADVDLELGRLTVIVGPTGSGKSALVRSLQAALFNWTGGQFVRKGATSAKVTLDFEDAVLEWEKPVKGGATYRLITPDGEQLATRVGRDLPPDIAKVTGIRELQVDGAHIRPNFDCQFDEPFLLASTGGQAAKLLAHVSKMDQVVRAQVAAKRDRDRAERAAADSESRAETIRAELGTMPDYPDLLARWESLQERLQAARSAEAQLATARAAADRLRQLVVLRAGWEGAALPERAAGLAVRAEAMAKAAGFIVQRGQVAGRLDAMRRQLTEARQRLQVSEERLHGVLDKLEICPVCGKAMK